MRAAGPRGTFPNGGSCGPGPSNCWHLPCAAKGNPGTEAFFKASRHIRRFESAAPNWRCLRAGGTGEGGAATHRCSSKSSRPCDWPQPGSGLVFVGGGDPPETQTHLRRDSANLLQEPAPAVTEASTSPGLVCVCRVRAGAGVRPSLRLGGADGVTPSPSPSPKAKGSGALMSEGRRRRTCWLGRKAHPGSACVFRSVRGLSGLEEAHGFGAL